MVADKTISARSGLLPSPPRTATVTVEGQEFNAPNNIASIVDVPRLGEYKREVVSWRTPHLGVIQMYISPQSISILDSKDVSHHRTKAGFVIQYAGEKLTDISINGTTGSGGIEAINILESIYRSEQEAFTTIAQSLERKYTVAQLLSLFKGPNNFGDTGFADALGIFLGQTAEEAVLNIFEQPFPTLASLASNIEMIYQGVTYRGYFQSFRVDENVNNGPGIFNYDLKFVAYAKQGVRRNFMPWHRQPYNPANIEANPQTFSGSIEEAVVGSLSSPEQPLPELSKRPSVAETGTPVQRKGQQGRAGRDVNNSLGRSGQSLLDLNLEDTEV